MTTSLRAAGFAAADAYFDSRPYPASMRTYRIARTVAKRAVLAAYDPPVAGYGTDAASQLRYRSATRYARRVARAACATERRG
jgi:hypothetical protein